MPYLATAQEWLTQSALLLEARPSTVSEELSSFLASNCRSQAHLRPGQTRITTKYSVLAPSSKAKSKPSRTARAEDSATPAVTASSAGQDGTATPPAPPPIRAKLTLKTYDPASGVALKYETDKQAEVGRLISSLAKLGRTMAGLPEVPEDSAMLDAPPAETVELATDAASLPSGAGGAPAGGNGTQVGPQGAKKGKKKGKR
jgi:hypothetical protein